ncbi:MAG: carboxypeptidase regulatory-like domain-containing protein [Enhygromyxa sp.]
MGVSGTVSVEGKALAGARVCAWNQGPNERLVREQAVAPVCTNTDGSGGFALTLAPGIWAIVASAREHLPRAEEVAIRTGAPVVAVNLSLRRGGQAYSGTIVDLEGKAVAGIEVQAMLRLGRRTSVGATTTTDERGHYELWSGEEASVSVNAPGYARMIPRGETTSVLLPESVIAGRVVDDQGEPVAGARVAQVERFGATYGFPRNATRTDDEGGFRLTQLMPGEYTVLGLSDSGGGMSKAYVGLAATRDDVTIELEQPLTRLRARFVDDRGEPATSCLVQVSRKPDEKVLGGTYFWTDHEGLLDAPVVEGSYHVLGLTCPGLIGKPPYQPIPAGKLDAELPTLTLERGRALRGRLLDSAGQPLAHRAVLAQELEPDFDQDRPSWRIGDFATLGELVETDADGRFEIGGLPPGSYELAVLDWSEVGDPLTFTIAEVPVTEASFTLPPTGRIEVHVRGGRAGQIVRVEHCDAHLRDWRARPWTRRGELDAEGRAVFEIAPPGRHSLVLDGDASCDDPNATRIEVVAGDTQTVELVSTSQDPSATSKLRVRVVSSEGEPVANAIVEVDLGGFGPAAEQPPTRVDWKMFWESLSITDAEGRVELEVRPDKEGPWPVAAVRPGQFGSGMLTRGGGELTIRLAPIAD